MDKMDKKIKGYLREIENSKNIKILLACETGSRAWGFPSPDSDFDIRLIYKHPIDWHLNLTNQKDTIEVMFDNNEIDITGWELKKALLLLKKSNPPLLERIQSPIVYFANDSFLNDINNIARSMYSKIATMHHYLSMSKKMFNEVLDNDQVKLKKLFYTLRSAIACKWIMEKDEIPPIVFQTMLEELSIDQSIKNKIYQLIELKATKLESYIHHHEMELNIFIKEIIDNADTVAPALPPAKGEMDVLNEFFKKYTL